MPLELRGQRGCRHRPVAGGVAAPALGVRGVEDDERRRAARPRGPARATRGAGPRRCRGCRRPWSARGRSGRRRPARAGRTRPRSRRGRAARCRRRRAGRRRRRPPRAGSARPPTWTSRNRTGRPGRRGPGREGSPGPTMTWSPAAVGAWRRGAPSRTRPAWRVGRAGPMLRATLAGFGAGGPAPARSARAGFDGVNVVVLVGWVRRTRATARSASRASRGPATVTTRSAAPRPSRSPLVRNVRGSTAQPFSTSARGARGLGLALDVLGQRGVDQRLGADLLQVGVGRVRVGGRGPRRSCRPGLDAVVLDRGEVRGLLGRLLRRGLLGGLGRGRDRGLLRRRLLGGAFLAGAFFARLLRGSGSGRRPRPVRWRGAFLAGVFLAAAFSAGAFVAGAFFAGAFLTGAFLAGFLTAFVATGSPWTLRGSSCGSATGAGVGAAFGAAGLLRPGTLALTAPATATAWPTAVRPPSGRCRPGPSRSRSRRQRGDVRDVLDLAERVLAGHGGVLPTGVDWLAAESTTDGKALRRRSGTGRARRGSCRRGPGRGG